MWPAFQDESVDNENKLQGNQILNHLSNLMQNLYSEKEYSKFFYLPEEQKGPSQLFTLRMIDELLLDGIREAIKGEKQLVESSLQQITTFAANEVILPASLTIGLLALMLSSPENSVSTAMYQALVEIQATQPCHLYTDAFKPLPDREGMPPFSETVSPADLALIQTDSCPTRSGESAEYFRFLVAVIKVVTWDVAALFPNTSAADASAQQARTNALLLLKLFVLMFGDELRTYDLYLSDNTTRPYQSDVIQNIHYPGAALYCILFSKPIEETLHTLIAQTVRCAGEGTSDALQTLQHLLSLAFKVAEAVKVSVGEPSGILDILFTNLLMCGQENLMNFLQTMDSVEMKIALIEKILSRLFAPTSATDLSLTHAPLSVDKIVFFYLTLRPSPRDAKTVARFVVLLNEVILSYFGSISTEIPKQYLQDTLATPSRNAQQHIPARLEAFLQLVDPPPLRLLAAAWQPLLLSYLQC